MSKVESRTKKNVVNEGHRQSYKGREKEMLAWRSTFLIQNFGGRAPSVFKHRITDDDIISDRGSAYISTPSFVKLSPLGLVRYRLVDLSAQQA